MGQINIYNDAGTGKASLTFNGSSNVAINTDNITGLTGNIQEQINTKAASSDVTSALALKANSSNPVFTGNLGTSGNLIYRQLKFEGSGDTTTPAEDAYRYFNGFNFKNIGMYQFRGGSQYLHLRTNLTGENIMFQSFVHGYLYNNGNCWGIHGGYTYQGSIINQFTQTQGNYGFSGSYRGSGGNLCLRFVRGDSGYTEGYVTVYFHSFDTATQNACSVISYAQNNTSGSTF